jgi:hypothetical protein
MPKRFSLAEAQALIPMLDRLLREAIAVKADYEEAERQVQSFSEHVMMMGGVAVDRARVLELRKRREAQAAALRRSIEQILESGCQIKDLDIGLIDFPTLFHGDEVYLCWKLGESAIEFWHGLDEGFRGRKAIDQDFLDNHEGDPPE